jgi:hypothetical protein
MTTIDPSLMQKLVAALEQYDATQRDKRADRIIWMSSYNQRPRVIMGPKVVLDLLEEAEAAYREGHFISVILLAQALIEHELVGELVRRKVGSYGEPLKKTLGCARKHQVLADDVISRIDDLRCIRNPFAHLKQPNHAHTFGNRYQEAKLYPTVLLQQDAQKAFKLMFEVFRAFLREVE